MKILALADIHGREDVGYMAQELYGIHDFDLVVIAGDITNFGPGVIAEHILDAMPTAVMAVPGNCDPVDVVNAIDTSGAINLHFRSKDFRGYTFAGVGGVNSGFNMGITFLDEDAQKFLSGFKKGIFVVHQPPYGIFDRVSGGRHVGSRGIMKAVKLANPELVISGHVHEDRGYAKFGNTIFVNPGPARDGYAALIDLKSKTVNMLER